MTTKENVSSGHPANRSPFIVGTEPTTTREPSARLSACSRLTHSSSRARRNSFCACPISSSPVTTHRTRPWSTPSAAPPVSWVQAVSTSSRWYGRRPLSQSRHPSQRRMNADAVFVFPRPVAWQMSVPRMPPNLRMVVRVSRPAMPGISVSSGMGWLPWQRTCGIRHVERVPRIAALRQTKRSHGARELRYDARTVGDGGPRERAPCGDHGSPLGAGLCDELVVQRADRVNSGLGRVDHVARVRRAKSEEIDHLDAVIFPALREPDALPDRWVVLLGASRRWVQHHPQDSLARSPRPPEAITVKASVADSCARVHVPPPNAAHFGRLRSATIPRPHQRPHSVFARWMARTSKSLRQIGHSPVCGGSHCILCLVTSPHIGQRQAMTSPACECTGTTGTAHSWHSSLSASRVAARAKRDVCSGRPMATTRGGACCGRADDRPSSDASAAHPCAVAATAPSSWRPSFSWRSLDHDVEAVLTLAVRRGRRRLQLLGHVLPARLGHPAPAAAACAVLALALAGEAYGVGAHRPDPGPSPLERHGD